MIVYKIEDCINGRMNPFDKPIYTVNKDTLKDICEKIYNKVNDDELVEKEYLDEVVEELKSDIRDEARREKELESDMYSYKMETEIIEVKYPHIIYRKNNTIYISRFYYAVDEDDEDYKSMYCKNIIIEKIDALD